MADAVPFKARVLGPDDAPALARVDRACVIEADLALRFDRGEDFFAWPRICFDRHVYMGVEVDGEIVGYGMVGSFRGTIDDRAVPCCYAGDARVVPAWRQRGVLNTVVYATLAQLWPDTDHGYGIVAAGNRAGTGVAGATARHPGFPGAVAASLEAAVLPALGRLRPVDGIVTRPARGEDAPLIAQLLREHLAGRSFAPIPTSEDVVGWFARPGLDPSRWILATRAGHPVGVLGAWDMAPLRATEVVRYSFRAQLLQTVHAGLRLVRPAMPRLPRPGHALRLLTTTHVGASDPAVLRAMLARVVERGLDEGFHAVTVGFVGDDPLAPAVRGLLRHSVRSAVYRYRRGAPPPRDERPWIDLSFI
jgi:hypothetical protein